MNLDQKPKYKKYAILIPDGEWDKLTNQVLNCFSETNGVLIFVMSSRKYIASRYSRFVKGFSYYPKTDNHLAWISYINKEVRKHNIYLILPVFEEGIEILIQNRNLISNRAKLAILPSLSSFKTAKNKQKLEVHLAKHNIPRPKVFKIKSAKDINKLDCHFPILAKPLDESRGGEGIKLINHKESLTAFLKNKKLLKSKFIFQEYIDGFDIDCSVLCRNGIIKAFTIQKGVLYDSNPFSPPIGIQFVNEPRLYEVVAQLMRTLNWSGVAHVDLRHDINKGDFKVIEVNCRFWTSLEGSLAAGVNFPYLYTLLSLNADFKVKNYRNILFLNLRALGSKLRSNVFFVFKIKFIWNNTPIKYLVKDPIPILTKMYKRFYNSLFR